MLKRVVLCTCLTSLCLILAAGFAPAFDTSPYLLGVFNEEGRFTVINPTTKWLTVYGVSYWEGMIVECYKTDIPPNGSVWGGYQAWDAFGAIKIFAFPQGTRKFDPNAVIGGFQMKGSGYQNDGTTESNLEAVAINSYTLREFSMIPPDDHKCFSDPE